MIKQTLSQKIGRTGERCLRQELPSDWIFQPPSEDIGIDGNVVICDTSKSNGLDFKVQIKSSEKWTTSTDSITLKIKKSNVEYRLSGFSPTLIVLYSVNENLGWYSWLNELISENPSKLQGDNKYYTLKIPLNQRLDTSSWDSISKQLYSLNFHISRRLLLSGMVVPIIKTVNCLIQSLQLIEICKHNFPMDFRQMIENKQLSSLNLYKDQQLITDLLQAEATAHREIATALLELDKEFNNLTFPSTGAKETAKKYSEICSRFITNFNDYVKTAKGVRLNVDPISMFKFRDQAIREVVGIINKLTSLALSILPHQDQ